MRVPCQQSLNGNSSGLLIGNTFEGVVLLDSVHVARRGQADLRACWRQFSTVRVEKVGSRERVGGNIAREAEAIAGVFLLNSVHGRWITDGS